MKKTIGKPAGRGRRSKQDTTHGRGLLKELFALKDKRKLTLRQLTQELHNVGYKIAYRTLMNWSAGAASPRPESFLGLEVALERMRNGKAKA